MCGAKSSLREAVWVFPGRGKRIQDRLFKPAVRVVTRDALFIAHQMLHLGACVAL